MSKNSKLVILGIFLGGFFTGTLSISYLLRNVDACGWSLCGIITSYFLFSWSIEKYKDERKKQTTKKVGRSKKRKKEL